MFITLLLMSLLSLFSLDSLEAEHALLQTGSVQVTATVETQPVPSEGDAADDPAIWLHPTDPSQSVILGTDKKGGLAVYDLRGALLQYLPDGQLNNVDLRYDFPLGGQSIALVTATNRSDNTIAVYRMDAATRQLENVAAHAMQPGIDVYGSCMYRSAASGTYYVYVNSQAGDVEQWELFDDGAGAVDGARVRTFTVGSQVEGCVADDELGYLYISEEQAGIWKYNAEPYAATERTQVGRTGATGHLAADVEGLTLYYGSQGTGYLIASSQGNSTYVLYRRDGENDYVATFRIATGNGIDQVTHTDGIDVISAPLGPAFPQGVFVVQDDENDGDNQNYKLVPWQAIATAVEPSLLIDTTWIPRQPATAWSFALQSLFPDFTPVADESSNAVESDSAHRASPLDTTGQSRGYQTTPQELAVIQQKAAQGIEPYHTAVDNVLDQAKRKWTYGLDEHQTCKGADNPAWLDEEKGIPRLYARALAYHLTGDSTYAQETLEILQRIMTEVKQFDLNEQQCRLNLGWGTPELVAAADLIEGYWHDQTCTGPTSTLYADTTIGSGSCKVLFQNWLIKNPYYVVSYTAEDAQSNWGAAATNTAAYIADYLWDRPDTLLIHRVPLSEDGDTFDEIGLIPATAYARARQLMLARMNGYRVDLHSSSSCDYLEGSQQNDKWTPVKSQITENGIIPEDARREEYCNIPVYNGEYQNYPQIHVGNNIQQCELLLRRGDSSCYDNVDNSDVPDYTFVGTDGKLKTTHLYPGRGSLERAIKAIIVDAQTEWKHDSALELAYHYYYVHHTLPGFELWYPQLDRPGGCDQDVCFGTLTHGFAAGEMPQPPPTVQPPLLKGMAQ